MFSHRKLKKIKEHSMLNTILLVNSKFPDICTKKSIQIVGKNFPWSRGSRKNKIIRNVFVIFIENIARNEFF